MTRYSQATGFQTGSADRIAGRVAAARVILAWERLWPALWPASGIIGLFLAAMLFDLFAPLPWPLHALILASFVTAIALALYFNLDGFAWPRWEEGARRLERDSALAHRPISEAGDRIAVGAGDPEAEELWRAHLAARLRSIGALRLKLPRSALPKKDPRALRFVVLVLVGFGALVAGSDWNRRLEAAFAPNAGALATLDAWIDPPAYTGEVPVYLKRNATLSVPAGSTVHLRVHGADHLPSITLDGVRFEGGEGEYAASAKLTESGRVRVRVGGHTIGNWKLAIIPDKPPTIAFAGKPEATERQALKLTYKAGDDYGIAAVRAVIRPHGRKGPAIRLDLPLPAGKAATQSAFRDLTQHPYAGLEADITLYATDALNQIAKSNTVVFKLPQRIFTDPLARALIEQRQILASEGPPSKSRVLRALDAFSIAPDRFYVGQNGVYLALRAAFWALKYAANGKDFKRVEDLLWQTAVGIEQGGILNMAEQLRRMQQLLTQMIARGAPQSEIDQLLARYRALMQQYLTALAQHGTPGGSALPPDARVLGAADFDELLKAIEGLLQSGDRLRAMQLLAMLQDMMENLRVAQGSGAGTQGDSEADQALRGLGELMGKQRLLLDKTFRQGQGMGDPKDGGAQGLAGQQGALRGDLGKLQKQQSGKKGAGDHLKEADRLMGEAEGALREGDFPRASTLQKYVLDALRKGAQALAGNRGQQPGKDPFGRSMGNSGSAEGDVRIPDASVLQRARDILLELRKRAGQQGRPKEELDYIDRLLKQF